MAYFHNIPGWFDWPDFIDAQIAKLRDGAHVVETGVFLGKSAAYWGEAIQVSGKRIRFDAVDSFEGLPADLWGRISTPDDFTFADQEALRDANGLLYTAACENLAPLSAVVSVIPGDALAQASCYADESLDVVFLDDDHTSPHVAAELDAYWPKLKRGGILAGHDFDWPDVQKAVAQWGLRRGIPIEAVSARSWACTKPVSADTWLVPPKKRRCLVAVCCNERSIPRQTAESLIRIGWGQRVTDAATQYGFARVDFAWFHKYLSVADLRDEAAYTALCGGYSHLLFLDADMTWPPDVLQRMLAHHGRGVVGGLYHLKQWPHWPVALKDPQWNPTTHVTDYHYDEQAPYSEGMLRPESLLGMGCTIIPTEVFRRFERPWFKYAQNAANLSTVTEDVYFCEQAGRVGCPIWLDPDVICQHISSQAIGTSWYDRSQVEMRMLANGQRLQFDDQPKDGPA